LRHFLLFLVAITAMAAGATWMRYGGGEPYEDLSTAPILTDTALEVALSYPEPIGNVAVGPDGRLFFTVHPESRPQGNRLLEYVDGAAEPYPSGAVQLELFDTVLGLEVDGRNRLWTIDNGNHGFGVPRLLAFDLETGNVVHDHGFSREHAPAGSFLQDLAITRDGRTVFIADASVWRKRPAIVAYDVATRTARRLLESHVSVSAENYLIRNSVRDMRFAGGLVTLKTGVDGIVLGPNDEWLYYAAINNSYLYRVPVRALRDHGRAAPDLEAMVEQYSRKPLNDGLEADSAGNIYITDVERSSVYVVDDRRDLRTLIRSPRIRWADSLSFDRDGWLYLADSAIPEQVLRSRDYILSRGPYLIFRFRPPGVAAEAGSGADL